MTLAKRVLVVEDQMMIAFALKDMLTSMGLECVGPFRSAADALNVLDHGACDFALLDINLGDTDTSEPVAQALVELDIPFVFVTGYGSAAPIDEKFNHVDRYLKPIRAQDIRAAIQVT
ncbi:response regulator [uncultured Roseobacter sp.]|uniref:response regulator n=1 Tax=uncultured Roseobacter sp. TaxID=114847 RepID=UPI00261AB184|nr:response regulator [uncultured Roseobacter sp.]